MANPVSRVLHRRRCNRARRVSLPYNPDLISAMIAEKRARSLRETGRARPGVMILNAYQTNQGRMVWTPEMGDYEIPRGSGPTEADPTFWELVEGAWIGNELANDGEEYVLDAAFRGATAKTNIYATLWNDTPVDTDDPSTLVSEVTGTGYGAITYACNGTDFPTLALDGGDFKMDGAQKTFTATGTWTAATYFCFLDHATLRTATELLINYVALSATRTLQNGDSLNVTPSLKLA